MENNKKEEDRRFYVYEHIRKDNNTCFYVGKGTGDRAYNLDRGNFHNGVCKEYGCRVKIIKDGLTEKEAFALERERIEDYVITFGYGAPIDGYRDYSNNYLTNFTWGGEGTSGYKFSEEQKQKISEKVSGEKNGMYGKNPWNKGKEMSEEFKIKNSESHKGQIPWNKGEEMSEEQKQKISEKLKGGKLSEDTKLKISEKLKGENNPFYGKHHSKETIEKLSKKVTCITTGEEFDSIKDAAIHYNISQGNISSCCIGTRKHAGKLNGVRLQWKYAEDDDNESKVV